MCVFVYTHYIHTRVCVCIALIHGTKKCNKLVKYNKKTRLTDIVHTLVVTSGSGRNNIGVGEWEVQTVWCKAGYTNVSRGIWPIFCNNCKGTVTFKTGTENIDGENKYIKNFDNKKEK